MKYKTVMPEFCIRDNGTTCPDTSGASSKAVKAKNFHPFYTTKLTNMPQLLSGLSLAYDIVANGHWGPPEVIPKEGERTSFIITLPTKSTLNA